MALNKRGFFPSGPTILVAGAATAPTGVHAANTNQNTLDAGAQVRLHNAGPNLAFVAFATTATGAQAAAVIPLGGAPTNVIPLPSGAIEVLTAGKGMYWSAICVASETASVYVTPGDGL